MSLGIKRLNFVSSFCLCKVVKYIKFKLNNHYQTQNCNFHSWLTRSKNFEVQLPTSGNRQAGDLLLDSLKGIVCT